MSPTPRRLRVPLASTAPWGVVSQCPAIPAISPTSHRQPSVWSALLASTACLRKWLLVRTLCHLEGSGGENSVIWREVVVRTLCHLGGGGENQRGTVITGENSLSLGGK